VLHVSSVLFDDGEVHCRIYDLWLSSKLSANYCLKVSWTLKYCNINILTSIHMQNKLKYTLHLLHMPHVTKAGKLTKKSFGKLVVTCQIYQTFYAKVFLPYSNM